MKYKATDINIQVHFIYIEKLITYQSKSSWDDTNFPEYYNRKKVDLIESLLVQIPIGFFVVNQEQNNVVKGKSKVAIIRAFVNNEFPLSELTYLPMENGKFFKDLDPWHQRRILQTEVPTARIAPATPTHIYNDLYSRFNPA